MARKPTQPRAKATVDAIIEAGFMAVAQSGIHGATTRQIAEISGVGVGSLYEYFDNKEAIYAAMNERFVNDILEMLRKFRPELVRVSLADLVKRLLYLFRDLLQMHNAVYLKYFRYSRYSPQIESELMELAMHYAIYNPKYLRLQNMMIINYICINGGIQCVIRHLSAPNPNMSFDELIDGLSRMTTSYVNAELEEALKLPFAAE
jgi:AcrR family transcriptional regulator